MRQIGVQYPGLPFHAFGSGLVQVQNQVDPGEVIKQGDRRYPRMSSAASARLPSVPNISLWLMISFRKLFVFIDAKIL